MLLEREFSKPPLVGTAVKKSGRLESVHHNDSTGVANKAQRFSPADRSAFAMRMTMTTFRVVAIAAGLLLAVSGLGLAAKHTRSHMKSQFHAAKSSGSVNSAIRPYSSDPHLYIAATTRMPPG